MYNRDKDSGKWLDATQTMEKNVYDNYKQDQIKVRMYSKCLSGAVYFPTSNVDNIYELSKYRNKISWFYGTDSPYAVQQLPVHEPKQITPENISEYKSFTRDYGMTVKNLFTTDKLIGANLKNFYEVDLITVSSDDLSLLYNLIYGSYNEEVYVDSVRLKNGHTILIKDIMETISLPFDTDPNTYFVGNYYKIEDSNSSSDDYKIYSKDNGLYTYQDGRLFRTTAFDIYENAYNLSLIAKLGTNKGSQFHLSRLLNGTFPTIGMPIEFLNSKNWVIRNVFDYNNIYDVVLHSVIVTSPKELIKNGLTYTIPGRTLSVGEFGTIVNAEYESGIVSSRVHLINTKYKDTLNCIVENNKYYWACGENGILIKIDIISFEITNYDLNIATGLNKIKFFDNLNGVVVGDFGEIYTTTNAGETWEKQYFEALLDDMFYDVFYYKLNQIFIVGAHGMFVQMDIDGGKWKAWIKQVIKTVDYYDEYLLHNDINSIIYSNNPIVVTGDDGFGNIGPVTLDEYFFMATSGGEIIIKSFNDKHEFIFLDVNSSENIRSLVFDSGTNYIYLMGDTVQSILIGDFTLDVGGNGCIYNEDPLVVILNGYVNDLDLDGNSLYSCGNTSGLYKNNKTTLDQDLIAIDPNYGNADKSKLLFLDYDIASKLTFFDDNGHYVLPAKGTISVVNLKKFELTTRNNEYNWISYYLDSLKKYEFYKQISDTNVVQYSTKFNAKVGVYKLDSISEFVALPASTGATKCLVSKDYSKFSQLLPNSGVTTTTGFNANTPLLNRNAFGTFSTTASDLFTSFSYCVMLYKYMMIIKMPHDINHQKGDAFNIDSTYVNVTLVMTKLYTYAGYDYLFFETDFNDSMINNILDNASSLKITNLNLYSNVDALVSNFKKHPLSIAYDLSVSGTNLSVNTRFNNKTAYYNLQTKINYTNDVTNSTQDMVYSTAFAKFGYSPTYNLLNYLGNINDQVFTSDKVFTAMPQYKNIPLNGMNSSNEDNVFIDFGRIKTNYLSFGENLYFEWESIWVNTFVDLDLVFANETKVSTSKMLITKKYKLDDRYIIEFDKTINFTVGQTSFVKFDIRSRNTLSEISSDLQSMNNIQRGTAVKKIGTGYVTNLESELASKFPTDSYCKVFMSDYDIKDNLTGIIYTDYDNSLAFNIIKTEHNVSLSINNAYKKDNKVVFNLTQKHGAKVGDYVIVKSNGGYVNPIWLGFAAITEVIDENTIRIEKDFGTPTESGCDAVLFYVDNDPFLNFQPVDIMDLGVDIDVKQAVELTPNNIKIVGDTVSLVDVNYTKYRYTCVDGLSVSIISDQYSWLLNAEISNAVIGYDENGIIWYSGDWKCGRWFGNKWYSGRWFGGDWYSGDWYSKKTSYDNLVVSVAKVNDTLSSKWYTGRWFDGSWNGGSWYDGRLYAVTWNGGIWNGGIWNDGTWFGGEFKGGIWVAGIWYNGIFNTDSKPAYWLDGKWSGGDFENGRWFTGEFSEKTNPSRFGTKSSNTRNSVWDSGNWLGGEFHSSLATLPNGDPIQSDIHRFSYWKTGTWGGGNFYGGTTFNIRFKGGNWYGGVSDDIEVVNSEILFVNDSLGVTNSSNKIRLNGVFHFNIDDEITITGDERSNIGKTTDPMSYRVSSSFTDDETYTELELVSLNPIDQEFRLFLVFLKMEYIIRLGVVIDPLYITFIGQTGELNIYDHLKQCVYGDINGVKPTLVLSDLITVNNLLNSCIVTSGITIDFNRMDTTLRVVSKFSNSNWYSGVWYNGVYESGSFTGGIWYDGNFRGQWG